MRGIVALALVLAPTLALAQQPAQKDRKDYLIEGVESQRNDALSKLAVCYADANGQIATLTAQVQALQAQIKSVTPPPIATPTTPPQ